MKKKYQCCFCGKEIKSNHIDITSLVVISNWDKTIDNQQEQQLFCHMNCLKDKVNKEVPLYIAEIVD
ncbi:hypothetical protein [Vallitalea sp.]|uniref:hypothetical protein n=1 Tax=Vallitalea sp. TaxID=1882829 RepID=UPI0025CED5C8|nr:hypothetical protein [Vallitalea sp.]MCT4686380.1 hypothetical protein [Vallitalea sp.]